MEAKVMGAEAAARIRHETFVRHVEAYERIGSTNDRALELASDQDLSTPVLVLAEHQLAGRGRGGNSWQSTAGALTFSLLIDRPTKLPNERLPLLSLIAGLAAREAVENVTRLQGVKVKWPNDIYFEGRKLGGILTEVPSVAPDRAVIGIGINVSNRLDDAPADVRRRAISLIDAMGRPTDRTELLISILVQLESILIEFLSRGGVPSELWSPHCLLSEKQIRLRTPKGEIDGQCLGVAEDGALLLRVGSDLQRVYSAEAITF